MCAMCCKNLMGWDVLERGILSTVDLQKTIINLGVKQRTAVDSFLTTVIQIFKLLCETIYNGSTQGKDGNMKWGYIYIYPNRKYHLIFIEFHCVYLQEYELVYSFLKYEVVVT